MEIASNDGYLLQHYVKKKIPCLGIEPSAGVIKEAKKKGVKTINEFFNYNSAKRIFKNYQKTDLIIANNVLAHIPDLKEFINSSIFLLKNDGVLSIEFPHLLNLIKKKQFDTIYDEHYYYFSLTSIQKIFNNYGMTIFDVDELPTHGGSLRVYVKRKYSLKNNVSFKVKRVLNKEKKEKLNSVVAYSNFQKEINLIKKNTLSFLNNQKNKKKK